MTATKQVSKANAVRGEVEIQLGDRVYVMKPEHERAVKLDESLRLGILGTLVEAGQRNSFRLEDMAVAIKCLADDAPDIETLKAEILGTNLYLAAITIGRALANIAGGSPGRGEGGGQSDKATGSTGLKD